MTVAQAQDTLENQAEEMQRLMVETDEANKKRDEVRAEVSSVSKEVGSSQSPPELALTPV